MIVTECKTNKMQFFGHMFQYKKCGWSGQIVFRVWNNI